MGPNRSQLINSSGCVVLIPVGPFGFDREAGFGDFPVMHALHCIMHQQQRNVRPMRPDALGAPGAGAPYFAKSLFMTYALTNYSPRRNEPSHPSPDASLLPILYLTH